MTRRRPLAARPAAIAAIAVSAACSAFPSPAAGKSVAFALAVEYDAFENPAALAIADLNGDILPELLTANFRTNDLLVRPGLGGGRFGTGGRFGVDASPVALAVADVDLEGHADVVVANPQTDDVSVLLGRGDGGFGPAVRFAAGDAPRSVAIGDLNGDGRPDVVTGNSESNDLSVLAGLGGGSFAPGTRHAVHDGPMSVGIGDVDGDGVADLVAGNVDSEDISVLRGAGGGAFEAARHYSELPQSSALAVGRLNADNLADVVFVHPDGVRVLLADGAGGLKRPAAGPLIPRFQREGAPVAPAIADMNGDGHADVAVALGRWDDVPDSGGVAVLLGDGRGTLGPLRPYRAGVGGTGDIAIGDLNSDGRPDLAASDFGRPQFSGEGRVAVLIQTTTPQISVDMPLRECLREPTTAHVRVDSPARLGSVEIQLDGRRLIRTTRDELDVRVPAGRLPAGRHTLSVKVRDVAGHRADRRVRFSRCRPWPGLPLMQARVVLSLSAFDGFEETDSLSAGVLTRRGRPAPRWSKRLAGRCGGCRGLRRSPAARLFAVQFGERIYLLRSDRKRPRPITNPDGGEDSSPAWSPTGAQIAFARHSRRGADYSDERKWRHSIQVVGTGGGAARRLTVGFAPAWSARGQIAFRRADGLYVMRADGTGKRRIRACGAKQPCLRGQGPGGTFEGLDWSPDGSRLAFCEFKGEEGGALYVADAAGNAIRRIARMTTQTCALAWSPDGGLVGFLGTGDTNEGGDEEMFTVRPDGTGRRRIIPAQAFDFAYDHPDFHATVFRGIRWEPLPW